MQYTNRIKNQNKPCAFHVITVVQQYQQIQVRRYTEYPKINEPNENR